MFWNMRVASLCATSSALNPLRTSSGGFLNWVPGDFGLAWLLAMSLARQYCNRNAEHTAHHRGQASNWRCGIPGPTAAAGCRGLCESKRTDCTRSVRVGPRGILVTRCSIGAGPRVSANRGPTVSDQGAAPGLNYRTSLSPKRHAIAYHVGACVCFVEHDHVRYPQRSWSMAAARGRREPWSFRATPPRSSQHGGVRSTLALRAELCAWLCTWPHAAGSRSARLARVAAAVLIGLGHRKRRMAEGSRRMADGG